MSHVAVIKAQIKSLESLKKACKELKLIFKEDQKTYEWFGEHVGDYPIPEGMTKEDMGKCLHAIEVPGADYEIGVIKDPLDPLGNDYKLIWDFWDRSLVNVLGKDAWKLQAEYEIQQGKDAALMNNCVFEQQELEDRTRLYIYVD